MRYDLYRHKITANTTESVYLFASNDSNKIYFRIFRMLQKISTKFKYSVLNT